MLKAARSCAFVLVACLIGLAVGCGSDDDDDQGQASSSGGGEASIVKEAKEAVAAAQKGTYRPPPSTGPAAQSGKNVWVISCGQSAPGCATPALGAVEAGKELGWDVTLFDGKLNPAGYNEGLKKAIAANADGIIPIAIDCPFIKGSLLQAKKAGIPVVGTYTFDCDDPSYEKPGEAQFTALNNVGKPLFDFFEDFGRAKANYAIAKGKKKVINIHGPDFQAAVAMNKGFDDELAKCEDCEVLETLEIPATQLTGQAAQRVQTALRQHPDAEALMIPYDAMTLVLAQVLAGANDDMLVLGGEGFDPNIDLMRKGVQDVATSFDTTWFGWSGADAMNRVLAGEKEIPDGGLGFQLIDESNLPASGGVKAPIDYKSAYRKVWNKG